MSVCIDQLCQGTNDFLSGTIWYLTLKNKKNKEPENVKNLKGQAVWITSEGKLDENQTFFFLGHHIQILILVLSYFICPGVCLTNNGKLLSD